MKLITPLELYEAARETCLRLYVANGGDARDVWRVHPYPGTAAIACQPKGAFREWTLGMPAFPLNARLPRWKSDLIGAYTVHELLHALWTDWNVLKTARAEELHSLCNALEDCRIEAKASRGELALVSEARRLLEALNAHIAQRALETAGFALDTPAQFSFVLGLVIFAEKLGYRSQLPIDWKSHVRPEWFPLFDLALARFDGLNSTADVLQLARDLKALAASLPKAKPQQPGQLQSQPQQNSAQSQSAFSPAPREREITEDENPPLEGSQEPQEAQTGTAEGNDTSDQNLNSTGSGEAPAKQTENEDDVDDVDDVDDDNNDAAPHQTGTGGGDGGGASEDEPTEDMTDAIQSYAEANLDDVADNTAREMNVNSREMLLDLNSAHVIMNADPLREESDPTRGSFVKAANAISSPAKLRRHLTLAVKSPERVSKDRRQTSGRLDMRNLVGIATGAETVFARRVEDEGREAAVALLLDVSGSMRGSRLAAAKAMALHMGDALKAAGVKFEIATFDDRTLGTPKPMKGAWNVDAKRAVAGLTTGSGTAMLPALKQVGARLLKVPNVTRRILLALTDGQDRHSPHANRTLCRHLRRRGVEVVGIGLMAGDVSYTFDGHFVHVWDVNQLSEKGLATLVKTLDQGAPRAA